MAYRHDQVMDVSPTTAALALLLAVLCVATFGRLSMAITAAVAATLLLNVFFMPPLGTLTIADPENWVALIVFLVVAVIGSQLSATAQSRAREATRGALASTLLASLSHDLRTPLTAIRVAVGNLADTHSDAERGQQADVALRELDRLTHLFDDILDMARIDSRAITPERQWVTPADVVDAAMSYAGRSLGAHNLQVDASVDTAVHIDPRLTSSALAQLFENAARYSPAGSTIDIHGFVRDGEVRISVGDAGPGLQPDDLARLFEPFFRGTASRATTGTGMGLAIARGLLSAQGGRTWAENKDDGGARFWIAVPAESRPVAVA
jgi:two-component system, OmpR family, sensor histidine kinase KdpD